MTRDIIEPLVAKYKATPRGRRPIWIGEPKTELQFVVSLLVVAPSLSATYDEAGALTGVRGLRLKSR